jgi:HSP20 family protein
MLPTTLPDTWTQGLEFPSRLFGTGADDYTLYEEDDEFVLTIDMPGFARDDITVSWDEGVLHIGAEHENEVRGQRKTYRRTFRLPKEIEPDEISAQYRNGVLDVRLPILGTQVSGVEIEVDG